MHFGWTYVKDSFKRIFPTSLTWFFHKLNFLTPTADFTLLPRTVISQVTPTATATSQGTISLRTDYNTTENLRNWLFLDYWTLKNSRNVAAYQAIRCNIPEDLHPQQHRCENLKPRVDLKDSNIGWETTHGVSWYSSVPPSKGRNTTE